MTSMASGPNSACSRCSRLQLVYGECRAREQVLNTSCHEGLQGGSAIHLGPTAHTVFQKLNLSHFFSEMTRACSIFQCSVRTPPKWGIQVPRPLLPGSFHLCKGLWAGWRRITPLPLRRPATEESRSVNWERSESRVEH